jgi:hypothetical protein
VDLDQDGNRDILSGSYSRMGESMAGLFQVLWGQPGGTFKKAEPLKGTDGNELIIPVKGKPGEGDDWINNICTRPFAADWDADGDLDLVVGNFIGTFYLFQGEGQGKFAPVPEEMKTGDGAGLKVEGHHGDPFVIDWDKDGDLDILSGSDRGGIQWAENRAGPGKPAQLAPFKVLIPAGGHVNFGDVLKEADIKLPLSSLRIWVDDYNGDGKLDIFVGDNVSLLSPADGLTEQQFREKFADWNKAVTEVSQQRAEQSRKDATQDNKELQALHERMNNLYQERTKFMKEDRTGFVWVYLQK